VASVEVEVNPALTKFVDGPLNKARPEKTPGATAPAPAVVTSACTYEPPISTLILEPKTAGNAP